jgi:glycine cleavage system transcriptional repressor
MPSFVLTAVGPDRSGLVETVSEFLLERSLNIGESKMAVLGGEFAIILLGSGSKQDIARLNSEVNELGRTTGLQLSVRDTIDPSARQMQGLYQSISVNCIDHPGIVQKITAVLKKHQANIESMETEIRPAPVTGAPVFFLKGGFTLPQASRNPLQKDLEILSEDWNLEIDLHTPQ